MCSTKEVFKVPGQVVIYNIAMQGVSEFSLLSFLNENGLSEIQGGPCVVFRLIKPAPNLDFSEPTPIEKDPKTWTSRAYLAREEPSQNQQLIDMFDGIIFHGRKLIVRTDYMINVGPIIESKMPKCASCKKRIETNTPSRQDLSELKPIGRGRLFNTNSKQVQRKLPEVTQSVNQATVNDKCVSFGAHDVRYFDPNERGSGSNDGIESKTHHSKLSTVVEPICAQKVVHKNIDSVLETLIVLLTTLNSKLDSKNFEDPYVRFNDAQ